MKYHLITGACGFVGRNLTKRLLSKDDGILVAVDDLSRGRHPDEWLSKSDNDGDSSYEDGKLLFYQSDIRDFLKQIQQEGHELADKVFEDVYHFAAIVGGRTMIDGDPLAIALNLSIDAELFFWASRSKPKRILYPSSSAAYPVALQTKESNEALAESSISLEHMGMPDMTYGWSKITGEYLAQIAYKHYGISVTCIRPFSGYGEDQEEDYPIPAIAARIARKEDPVDVWGTGEQGRDFVHIDDVIDLMLLAMEHIQDGTAINIGSGKLTSFNEIIHLMTGFAGYSPIINKLLDKPVGTFSRYCDMSFVNSNLSWTPKISIEEGMRRMYMKALVKQQT